MNWLKNIGSLLVAPYQGKEIVETIGSGARWIVTAIVINQFNPSTIVFWTSILVIFTANVVGRVVGKVIYDVRRDRSEQT